MKIRVKGGYGRAAKDIQKQVEDIPKIAESWTRSITEYHYRILLSYLETQGRAGGASPPLSDATRHLYSQRGEPDGSGIRDHIRREVGRTNNRWWGRVYIEGDDPSLVARVQDQGAIIQVTDAMRGFLAAHGIFLKQSTLFIEIPARHFWSDSQKRAHRLARRRLKKIMR